MELSLSPDKRYTYSDYLTWADNVRRELFDGIIKIMSPAPAYLHQKVSGNLFLQFGNYLKKRKCQVFHAPFDVRLPKLETTENEQIYTVVQPDLCIVCDRSKLDARGCLGAPDLIIEIVSLGNAARDIKEKYEIYEQAGVLEYWLVRPYEQSTEVFILNERGKYERGGTYITGDFVPVSIFGEDFKIDLSDIFEEFV